MKFTVINTRNKKIDQISAAEINTILASVFDQPLRSLGFEKVNQRKWVRATKPNIRELFSILALKGAGYSPIWGFSLDYVPHISGNRLKWHRTNKSALFDFRYNQFDDEEVEELGSESWIINSMYGRDNAIKQAEQVAEVSIREANKLWNSVQNSEDLLVIFEKQLQLTMQEKVNRFGFFNYTQHPIAYAFTLAKIGEQERANEMLRKVIQRGDFTEKCEEELWERLRSAATEI